MAGQPGDVKLFGKWTFDDVEVGVGTKLPIPCPLTQALSLIKWSIN